MTPSRDNLLRRAIRTLREDGSRAFWIRSLRTLGYRTMVRLERPLSETLPEATTRIPVQAGPMEPIELDAILRSVGADFDPAEVRSWLAGGDRCFVARREGRLVAWLWARERDIFLTYVGQPTRLPAGHVYLFGAWSDPAFRGQGLAPALGVFVLRHYRDAGLTSAFRLTYPDNRSALRAHAKLGFRPRSIVGCVCLGPWKRPFERGLTEAENVALKVIMS